MDYKRAGESIRGGRKWLEMSQKELAENAEITVSYLRQIERGEVIASEELIDKLAILLGLSVDTVKYPIHSLSLDGYCGPTEDEKLAMAKEVLQLALKLVD